MVSFGFFELINTLGVAVPTSHHWPLGDEGKQAKKFGGVSGLPPYPQLVPRWKVQKWPVLDETERDSKKKVGRRYLAMCLDSPTSP